MSASTSRRRGRRRIADEGVPAESARRLLLHGLGLGDDPARRATPAAVRRAIERMGFVQVDTISVVARAHDHILQSRFDGYRPDHLRRLLEHERRLFEHWTHDASVIPTTWLEQWKRRFLQYRRRRAAFEGWLAQRIGERPERVIRAVKRRIERDGAVRSRDFNRPDERRSEPWWGWAPHKAALEYLWRSGTLAVSRRDRFDKVYDLAERVFPELAELPTPTERQYADWACASALERLAVATPAELGGFFGGVRSEAARAWCDRAVASGRAIAVRVESLDGPPVDAVAEPTWRRRAGRAGVPERVRLLSPFDPIVRDRRRALRLFGFDYRFEAYVPAGRRRYGYYVLPLLEGDRLVGRLDAKFHRDRGELEVRGLWWENGVRATKQRRRALDAALAVYEQQLRA